MEGIDEKIQLALEPETEQVNQEPVQPPVEAPEEGQPVQVATVEKPKFYSPDELEDLISRDEDVDTTRLSPEGRLLMKSFQKGFTPKLQERSELKRELEILRKEVGSLKQPASIEEVFDKDPDGTLRYIDSQIAQARTKLDTGDAFEALKQIEELRSVRDGLLTRSMSQQKKASQTSALAAQAQAEVLRAVPDFQKKEGALTEFAIKELGYSFDDIRFLTDVSNTGKYASQFVIQVNKMYEMAKAKSTVETKVVKTPMRQEGAGTGGGDDNAATYRASLKKAQETGDWTDVLKLKGTLQKLGVGG